MEATVQEGMLLQESQAKWEENRDEQLAARESVGEMVNKLGTAFALQALADAVHREACTTVSTQGDRLIQVAHILHDLAGLVEKGDESN